MYCTVFHFLAPGQPGGGPKRGKGRGGGTAHNRPHPSSHSSIARAVSRDAARLERQKLNRDWDEVSERDRSQRVVEHKLILLRFEAFVIVGGVARSYYAPAHTYTDKGTKIQVSTTGACVCACVCVRARASLSRYLRSYTGRASQW